MSILELKNVNKKYDNGEIVKWVVNDISLTVSKGDFISIMGPSGSGKSTLLYMMSGILACDSGEIHFLGNSLNKLNEKDLANIRKHKMGFVFQQSALLKNLTILDNILLPAFHSKTTDKKEVLNYAKDLMKKLGIQDLSDRKLSEVSGGQLQRAGICRALIHKPSILFADEPTGSLNSQTSEEIMGIFNEINREGVTVVMVTHDRKVASFSNRVLFLLDGKIKKSIQFTDYNDISGEEKIKIISDYMDDLNI